MIVADPVEKLCSSAASLLFGGKANAPTEAAAPATRGSIDHWSLLAISEEFALYKSSVGLGKAFTTPKLVRPGPIPRSKVGSSAAPVETRVTSPAITVSSPAPVMARPDRLARYERSGLPTTSVTLLKTLIPPGPVTL